MELPELNKESVEETVGQGKRLIPWLPDPHECPDCSVYCDATHGYVEEQACYMDTWTCPSCSKRFYRDENDGL